MSNKDVVYLYDGSLEGLLSVIFSIYLHHKEPIDIRPEQNSQIAFGESVIHIPTNIAWARRVEKGIRTKTGAICFQRVRNAYLAEADGREIQIYRYIKAALCLGKKAPYALAHEDILAAENLSTAVMREVESWLGFLRFSHLEDGLYYAKYEPKHNVTTLLMPHFRDRFSIHPFLIHDTKRNFIGVYDLQKWYYLFAEELNLPDLASDEALYRKMWKSFFETISITERKNDKCQKNHMPLRYRKNASEFFPS